MSITMDSYLYRKALLKKGCDFMCKTLNKLNKMSAESILKKCGQYNQIPVNLDVILDTLGIISIGTDFDELEQDDDLKHLGEISGLVLLNDDDLGIFYKKTAGI